MEWVVEGLQSLRRFLIEHQVVSIAIPPLDAGNGGLEWADARKAFVQAYLKSEGKAYAEALEFTTALIDGFESPFGMELLATVDWLLAREGVPPTVPALREGLRRWRGGPNAAERKNRVFDDRALGIALARLSPLAAYPQTIRQKDPHP